MSFLLIWKSVWSSFGAKVFQILYICCAQGCEELFLFSDIQCRHLNDPIGVFGQHKTEHTLNNNIDQIYILLGDLHHG